MKNFIRQMSILIIIVGVVAGAAYGTERFSSVNPDSPLYVEKITEEAIAVALATDPEEKALLFTEMANERINELDTMVATGKTEYVEGLIRSYTRIMERAMRQILERIRERGGDERKALERVEKATEKHIRVLRRVLGQVPESARLTIRRVIRMCITQHERIMSRLRELKGVERKGGSERQGTKRGGNGKGRN